MPVLRPTTDGVVTIRSLDPGDAGILIEGRDDQFHRWLGPGDDQPQPVGCVVVDDEIVGWVDYDVDREWLRSGEVNVGSNVFASHRGKGYAFRAVQLLTHHLALAADHQTAMLLIHPQNQRSLALARRTRFAPSGDLDGEPFFTPLTYTDRVITIRRQRAFAVDAHDAHFVAYVDCDLANEQVPPGEANISYSSHPYHRGRGYVSRAVRLIMQFLSQHTAARRCHLLVDADGVASLRVAASVGANPFRALGHGGQPDDDPPCAPSEDDPRPPITVPRGAPAEPSAVYRDPAFAGRADLRDARTGRTDGDVGGVSWQSDLERAFGRAARRRASASGSALGRRS